MAHQTEYLYTGITHSVSFNSNMETPISYNDTFTVGWDVNFGIGFTFYNNIRSSMGQSTISNISDYTLIAFLCDSIDGSLNFVNVHSVKQYPLSSLTSGYILTNLTNFLEDFSNNDLLLENMSQTEIQKLKKSFKSIFRLVPNNSIVTTQSIQNGDLVQDLSLVVDPMQSGPYEVNYETIDILSPNDFTDNERQIAYGLNVNLLTGEGARCFYPKNLSELGPIPLVFCVRANAGNVEQYDTYLSLFASYGYFCISLFQDVTSAATFLFENGIFDLSDAYSYGLGQGDTLTGGIELASIQHGIITVAYIDHIKKNIDKISGGKFNNKIDFTKLIPMGHSRGGGAVISFYELIKNKTTATNLIGKFNTTIDESHIKCILALAPNKGDILQPAGSLTSLCVPGAIPSEYPNMNPPSDSTLTGLSGYRFVEYSQGISQPQTYLINSSNVSKLKLNINIPILFLYPEIDLDTDVNTLTLYKSVNVNNSGERINRKKIIFIKRLDHNGISLPAIPAHYTNGLDSIQYYDFRTNFGLIFNNLTSRILYLASNALHFISDSVYASGLNTDIFYNTKDFTPRNKALADCFEITEHGTTGNILTTIDNFSTQGFTTNIVGFTFGDAIDNDFKTHLNFLSEPGYTGAIDLYSKGLIFFQLTDIIDNRLGSTYPANIFDRLFLASDNGLVFSYGDATNPGSSYFIKYDYSASPIDLSSADFIEVSACQISGSTLNNYSEFASPLIFGLKLKDQSSLESSLLCLNYINGLPDPSPFNILSGALAGDLYTYSPITGVKFRLQDFAYKTAGLCLANITELSLLFGSDYGTTKGTVFIDEIVTLNGS